MSGSPINAVASASAQVRKQRDAESLRLERTRTVERLLTVHVARDLLGAQLVRK